MTSATTVRCPHCNSQLRVRSRRLDGKEAKCPRCTQTILLQRVQGTDDYIAVLFFQGHDERWATTIQPANRDSRSRGMVHATAANTVSYERGCGDRRWRWSLKPRARGVAVGIGLLFCVLVGGYSVIGKEYRVWQTADGRRSSAKLAYVAHNDRIVRLKRQDNGREIEVPIAKLSPDDRTDVVQRRTIDRANPRGPLPQAAGDRIERTSPRSTNSTTPTPADWPMWRGSSRDGVVSAGPSLLYT